MEAAGQLRLEAPAPAQGTQTFRQPTGTAGRAKPAGGLPTPRLAFSVDEAATALGVSRDHFERHVLGSLRVIYSGRRRLIPLRELERWVEREAVSIRR